MSDPKAHLDRRVFLYGLAAAGLTPVAGETSGAPSFIRVPGGRLRYELSGSGQDTIVLLHEMGMRLESWDSVMPELRRDRRVLRYDLRGFGQSDRITDGIGIEDEVGDLVALLDKLGIQQPVTLIGSELGGAIAMRFAAEHPDRARAILAMNPAAGFPPLYSTHLLANTDQLARIGARAYVDQFFDKVYPASLRGGQPERYARIRAMQADNDTRALVAARHMIARSEWNAIVPAIRCVTWIVASSFYTSRTMQSWSDLAAAIPNDKGRLEVLDTTQFIAIQSPELLLPILRRFFASIPA